ncbi:MAG TPA: formate/nitrite transporter family protein [bacterium]|nr:formate/nitrite transporter family protein [bacterium]
MKTGLCGNSSTGLTSIGELAVKVAETKINLSFTEAFSRGILCNMLVCLAVIMCISSITVTGKIFGIYFPIMTFVACGYEHSIANMYFLPVGLMVKGSFIREFYSIWKNLIPVTLGNIVGGLIIVVFHPKMLKKIFSKKHEF